MNDRVRAYDKYLLGAVVLLASGIFGFLADRYVSLAREIETNTHDLETELLRLEEKNRILIGTLTAEQKKNLEFEGKINEIVGTVGTLNKLANTDKEILQKYSKVYFLNEHYVPSSLAEIPEEYLNDKKTVKKIHSEVLDDLVNMIDRAHDEGVEIRVISSFRSFDEQTGLKGSYSVVYGTGANRFSADQGYSEHQLGTTLDFTTEKLGSNFTQFEDTLGYKWLVENAYKYGFVLSYPKGNAYYQFEPWHWRFVGKNLAKRLHEDGKYFYDLDQRTIDQYLVSVFD